MNKGMEEVKVMFQDLSKDELWELIGMNNTGLLKLEKENENLKQLIDNLKTGSCFCQAGIDNPMMHGNHSDFCNDMQSLLPKEEE